MNKSFSFKILYYVCFVLSVATWIIASKSVNTFGLSIEIGIAPILGLLNLILVIIFSLKLIKNKLENVNVLFPIIYLLFLIVVILLALVMNNKLMIPNMHYGYYISFILFNYLLLNIYSILSITKLKK